MYFYHLLCIGTSNRKSYNSPQSEIFETHCTDPFPDIKSASGAYLMWENYAGAELVARFEVVDGQHLRSNLNSRNGGY